MIAPSNRIKVWLCNSDICSKKNIAQFKSGLAIHKIDPVFTPEPGIQSILLFLQSASSSDDCLERCRSFQEKDIPIYVINTGLPPLPFYLIWQMLNTGIWDIFRWEEPEILATIIAARINRFQLVERILTSTRVGNVLIGNTSAWKKTLRQIIEVSCFSSAPVLILGETGTGKELVARLIHDLDRRPDKEDLVLLDCSAIVPDLFGSEFFGHEKGAYTNAVSVRDGAFALAHQGTLFLDEVGELPLNLQAALLRVIQEGTYKRVGGNLWKKTNFRLVSATNRILTGEVQERRFRADLYYRISTFVISLPKLDDRREDILDLARHFIGQMLKTDSPPPLGRHLRHYLLTRDYPGNIRELRQVINRLVQAYTGTGPLTIGHLPAFERGRTKYPSDSWREKGLSKGIRHALANGAGLKEIKRIAGDVTLELAIREANGHLPTAAQRLGVSERLVQSWWAERKNEGFVSESV